MARRAEIVLDPEEREVLERAAEGATSNEIASQLGCNPSTVGRWRGRFAKRGLDGCGGRRPRRRWPFGAASFRTSPAS
jgi:transposase-like protein